MIGLIFSMSICLFSSISLVNSITQVALDNTLTSLSYSLPKQWVVEEVEGSTFPMYDTVKVEESTIKHFKFNLKHYLNAIKVGFYYYDSSTLEEMKSRYVTGVRISLKAKISLNKNYYKAMNYTITKKG